MHSQNSTMNVCVYKPIISVQTFPPRSHAIPAPQIRFGWAHQDPVIMTLACVSNRHYFLLKCFCVQTLEKLSVFQLACHDVWFCDLHSIKTLKIINPEPTCIQCSSYWLVNHKHFVHGLNGFMNLDFRRTRSSTRSRILHGRTNRGGCCQGRTTRRRKKRE